MDIDLNPKFDAAISRITAIFLAGNPVSVAFSGGKDSSVLLDLTLAAAKQAKAAGVSPYILVTNGDTRVENPEVTHYLISERKKIEQYAKTHGIALDYRIAKPKLNDIWAVQIMSGRKLPSFPENNSDCSVDYKVRPMTLLRKELLKEVSKETGTEVVTLVGTRLSESAARNKKMTDRGESHLAPARNDTGDLVYAAIADFETEDVWEWIGMVRSGLTESYSDFDDLSRIYADAGNTSCAVVSDAITEGMKAQRGGCGARTGCIVCTKVKEDKSLSAMIESDERYAYLKPASKLREFIVKSRWDLDRRQWLGKTISDENKIKIQPDTYSPAMCLELLRYALTVDVREREQAHREERAPRFELVPIEALVAIDALWSLQGWHKPFQAIKEYIDIAEHGQRYVVPEIEAFERVPIPKARYLTLNEHALRDLGLFTGLRDSSLELSGESNCMGTRILNNGKAVLDVETDSSFTVDTEAAFLALEFELDTMLKINAESDGVTGLTQGYKWWLRMGTISLSPQQLSVHDEILKRTNLKEEMGVAGPYVTKDKLLAMADPEVSVSAGFKP